MPAWSGLWNGVYQENYAQIGTAQQMRRLRKIFGNRMVSLKARELLRTMVTDDVGSTALATHTRITSQTGSTSYDVGATLGGKRLIETITDINRAVAAADETAILKELDAVHTPTFPVEKSGNSGGGKQGF